MATELFGVANLLDELDKRVICTLRDGITFVGVLRTVDEFGNIVLHNAVERITIDRQYGEQDRGIVLVRGDNISMLGELVREFIFFFIMMSLSMMIVCCIFFFCFLFIVVSNINLSLVVIVVLIL
eukprot:m.86864 g.86864  ORF g.86864 m.86864 type:complete len:125 (+) comp12817_c0_seq4:167-541(+)